MKIDRLIGIITILQKKKKVTAPYLAERFEVSRRTINRDILDLCKAGIPIITTQGADGGISIMEGFLPDTHIFTKEDLASIFIGMKSIDSVSHEPQGKILKEKLGLQDASENMLPDDIIIDLSSHYKDSLAPKIKSIREAIAARRRISFLYYYGKGEEVKVIEPYYVVFQWSSWYVYGFCPAKDSFRMYKLNRLLDLQLLADEFKRQEHDAAAVHFENYFQDNYMITALFDKSLKFRLIEEYSIHSFHETEDGRLEFTAGFTNLEAAVSWFLSFGEKVEVISPEEIRDMIKNTAVKIAGRY